MTFPQNDTALSPAFSKSLDSLDEFFSSAWSLAAKEQGVEAKLAASLQAKTINTTATATSSSHPSPPLSAKSIGTSATSGSSSPWSEFGFAFFNPVFTSTTVPEEKEEVAENVVYEQPIEEFLPEGEYQHLIDTSRSSAESTVSSMTKATAHRAIPENDTAPAVVSPKSRKRTSPGTIQKALCKLTLCGHSAKEDSLDLKYLVMALRQALTAREAAESLLEMHDILKDGRTNGSISGGMSPLELQEGLVAAGADHCVISTLWNFPSHNSVQYYGITVLGELVARSHEANQRRVVLKGGIEVVLTAMKMHANEAPIQEEACRTLKNLMKYFDTAKQHVARHRGINQILQAMIAHPNNANVQRQACYALTSLSCLKPISDELVVKQGHAVLLKTMQHHGDDCYVLAEAWRTLTNIVIHSMNRKLDEEIAAHGLEFICQSLQHFSICSLVPIQARGLTLLTHLCHRSAANLEQLTSTRNLEILHDILTSWKYDEKIQLAGAKLVEQIKRAGHSMPHHNSSQAGWLNSARKKKGSLPPQSAVIGQISNQRGMDVIIDASMY